MTTAILDDFRPIRLLRALREFIGACCGRSPQGSQLAALRVAEEANHRRRQVLERLDELTRARSGAHEYDQDLVNAIMTDDGGRQPESGFRG
jgi:hypothetical protein